MFRHTVFYKNFLPTYVLYLNDAQCIVKKNKYLKHLLLSDISLHTKLSQALLKLEFFTFSQDYTEVEFTKLI